jgi:hypothetical protein
MNHSSVNPETVMVNNITNDNNMNHSSVKPWLAILSTITAWGLTDE